MRPGHKLMDPKEEKEEEVYVLPIECIYVFCIDLRINSSF